MTIERPFNADKPNWLPLDRALTAAGLSNRIGEFMWMGEWKQGEHSYKHFQTRSYAVLRADTGLALAAERVRKALQF